MPMNHEEDFAWHTPLIEVVDLLREFHDSPHETVWRDTKESE